MRCVACNAEASCIDSRPMETTRRRRYQCTCGQRFSTIEVREDMSGDDFKRLHIKSTVHKWWRSIHGAAFDAGRNELRDELRKLIGESRTE